MREVEINVIENKALLQGDNEFETGAITLTAGQQVKEGAFLKRVTDKEFALVVDLSTEDPVAIVPVDFGNNGTTPLKVSLRACIAGKMRADMLHINGTAATRDQIDLIRKFGFIPIYANDVSRT